MDANGCRLHRRFLVSLSVEAVVLQTSLLTRSFLRRCVCVCVCVCVRARVYVEILPPLCVRGCTALGLEQADWRWINSWTSLQCSMWSRQSCGTCCKSLGSGPRHTPTKLSTAIVTSSRGWRGRGTRRARSSMYHSTCLCAAHTPSAGWVKQTWNTATSATRRCYRRCRPRIPGGAGYSTCILVMETTSMGLCSSAC
jgi:hypothetical protein